MIIDYHTGEEKFSGDKALLQAFRDRNLQSVKELISQVKDLNSIYLEREYGSIGDTLSKTVVFDSQERRCLLHLAIDSKDNEIFSYIVGLPGLNLNQPYLYSESGEKDIFDPNEGDHRFRATQEKIYTEKNSTYLVSLNPVEYAICCKEYGKAIALHRQGSNPPNEENLANAFSASQIRSTHILYKRNAQEEMKKYNQELNPAQHPGQQQQASPSPFVS